MTVLTTRSRRMSSAASSSLPQSRQAKWRGAALKEQDQERAKAIGRRIAEARLAQGGMTQRELADLLDVSERSMQGYEIGEVIPYRLMPELSRVLQREVSWFLHGEVEQPGTAEIVQLLREIRDLLAER